MVVDDGVAAEVFDKATSVLTDGVTQSCRVLTYYRGGVARLVLGQNLGVLLHLGVDGLRGEHGVEGGVALLVDELRHVLHGIVDEVEQQVVLDTV